MFWPQWLGHSQSWSGFCQEFSQLPRDNTIMRTETSAAKDLALSCAYLLGVSHSDRACQRPSRGRSCRPAQLGRLHAAPVSVSLVPPVLGGSGVSFSRFLGHHDEDGRAWSALQDRGLRLPNTSGPLQASLLTRCSGSAPRVKSSPSTSLRDSANSPLASRPCSWMRLGASPSALGLTEHGLRHGGATEDKARGGPSATRSEATIQFRSLLPITRTPLSLQLTRLSPLPQKYKLKNEDRQAVRREALSRALQLSRTAACPRRVFVNIFAGKGGISSHLGWRNIGCNQFGSHLRPHGQRNAGIWASTPWRVKHALADRTAVLLKVAHHLHLLWSEENPQGSSLWKLPVSRSALSGATFCQNIFDFSGSARVSLTRTRLMMGHLFWPALFFERSLRKTWSVLLLLETSSSKYLNALR